MRQSFYVLTLIVLCFSCKKANVKAGDTVEIYLLKSHQNIAGKCQIDPSVSILQDMPIIKNQDILHYSKSDYQFKLTDIAIQKVKDFSDKTPFAVTVGKQVIYYGFFKPGFSSSSCDNSITMDVASGNNIYIRLGYPGPQPGVIIDDNRNHPNLMAALKNQGKLD